MLRSPVTGTHSVATTAVRIVTQAIVPTLTGIIVSGMATRTGSGIVRIPPGYYFAVAGMTVVTAQIGTMIPRIVGRYMTIATHRCPATCGVTAIALLGGYEMP
jgi:hypothetical protein